MSNKRNNERLQRLERENEELHETLRGSRKAFNTLFDHFKELEAKDRDITRALFKYENMLMFRLARWICRRKRPCDILVAQWEAEKENSDG